MLYAGLLNAEIDANQTFSLFQILNSNAKLSRWLGKKTRGFGNTVQVFDNQALNTLFNYGCRSFYGIQPFLNIGYRYKSIPEVKFQVYSHPAQNLEVKNDIYITDPPYGDAVKYEEITEFFYSLVAQKSPC